MKRGRSIEVFKKCYCRCTVDKLAKVIITSVSGLSLKLFPYLANGQRAVVCEDLNNQVDQDVSIHLRLRLTITIHRRVKH